MKKTLKSRCANCGALVNELRSHLAGWSKGKEAWICDKSKHKA